MTQSDPVNYYNYYATGLKKPREPRRKKIEIALHKLGSEPLSLELQFAEESPFSLCGCALVDFDNVSLHNR
ncbi:MAG: hypothetical protein M1292_03440 [Bacteroidetes bacterium]|nr:hypothetical protein [Bacteroidota bacterium]